MSVINFAECNYKILRSSSWVKPVKVVTDATRSGASKRRIGVTATPKSYSVTLSFRTVEDYDKFMKWFEENDLSGFHSFWMNKIDQVNGDVYEYRFAQGTQLNCSNSAGQVMEVSFELEELKSYR